MLDLAPWETLKDQLSEWTVAVSDTHGCVDLKDPVIAKPRHALMDAICPTLVLISHLKTLGWEPYNGNVTHCDLTKRLDSRSSLSKKSYFQNFNF